MATRNCKNFNVSLPTYYGNTYVNYSSKEVISRQYGVIKATKLPKYGINAWYCAKGNDDSYYKNSDYAQVIATNKNYYMYCNNTVNYHQGVCVGMENKELCRFFGGSAEGLIDTE